MKRYGIEKRGNQYRVVDISSKAVIYSKVLTVKEQKLLKETGKLPDGVTAKTQFKTIETFSTVKEAKQFIEYGCKQKKVQPLGIFQSAEQVNAIRKQIAKAKQK